MESMRSIVEDNRGSPTRYVNHLNVWDYQIACSLKSIFFLAVHIPFHEIKFLRSNIAKVNGSCKFVRSICFS